MAEDAIGINDYGASPLISEFQLDVVFFVV